MSTRRVTAAILFRDGRLLLAKRPAHSSLPGVWELPGGKVEQDEAPEACLAREMQEEFDVGVEVGELFASNTHAYDHGVFEILAYPIEIIAGELEAREHEAFDWFLPSEVEQLDVAPADIPIVRALLSQEAPPQDGANG
jgi:8-oxo-dGTP diphosphatase